MGMASCFLSLELITLYLLHLKRMSDQKAVNMTKYAYFMFMCEEAGKCFMSELSRVTYTCEDTKHTPPMSAMVSYNVWTAVAIGYIYDGAVLTASPTVEDRDLQHPISRRFLHRSWNDTW